MCLLFSVKNSSVPGGLVSELSIRNVRTDDSGLFTCIGRNHFGHDQTTIHFLVQGKFNYLMIVRMCSRLNHVTNVIRTTPNLLWSTNNVDIREIKHFLFS